MEDYSTQPDAYKKCKTCGEVFPATKEFFVSAKNGKMGLGSYCKACQRDYSKKWYGEHKEERLKQTGAYQRNHRERSRQYAAAYKKRNPEKVNDAYRKRYVANAEYYRKRTKQYIKDHPEYQKQWLAANRDKASVAKHKRRSLEAAATGSFSARDLEVIRKNQKGRCWYCGCDLLKTGEHVEHRIPLSRGGTNSPGNIVLSCPTCNYKKGSKLPHEWIGRLL